MEPQKKKSKNKIKVLHRYYSLTGFYTFVGKSIRKASLPIAVFIALIIVLDLYVVDFDLIFTKITTTFSPITILLLFFASESILGLIPPEIFIAWSNKTSDPILYLSVLACLSYVGGIVSFFIGRSILKMPRVFNYLEGKMKKNLIQVRKWGGFLIIVGALLPIPFSMTSMAAGVINYSFKNYLIFGLLRFLRFYLYAVVIFNIM